MPSSASIGWATSFDPPITDLTRALYFIVVTVSSVGYGDITPATLEAQAFLISVIILGVIVAGSAVGATLVPAFMRNIEKITSRKHALMKRTNHYIIVGRSALAGNTYLQLVERGEVDSSRIMLRLLGQVDRVSEQ